MSFSYALPITAKQLMQQTTQDLELSSVGMLMILPMRSFYKKTIPVIDNKYKIFQHRYGHMVDRKTNKQINKKQTNKNEFAKILNRSYKKTENIM